MLTAGAGSRPVASHPGSCEAHGCELQGLSPLGLSAHPPTPWSDRGPLSGPMAQATHLRAAQLDLGH